MPNIGERQFQAAPNGDVEAIHVFPELGDNQFTWDLLKGLNVQLKDAGLREDWIAFVGLQELYKAASEATRVG